jgi:hypothetical protein
MSQDSEWGGIFMIIGAVISAAVGMWQVCWIDRRQVKSRFKDLIDERMPGLKDKAVDAKTMYGITFNDLAIAKKRLEATLSRCKRAELEKQWNHYERLKESSEIERDRMIKFWDKFSELAS